MASRPPSQRPSASSQPSSSQESSPLHSPAPTETSSSFAHKQDEETLVLGPIADPASSTRSMDETVGGTQNSRQDSSDVRRCWICFSDETEDTPLSSEWKSPCPCALTAHESCLLDWVSDLEGSDKTRGMKRILCPQCKSEITIARPKNPLVEVYKGLDSMLYRLLLPGALLVATSSVGWLSASYGVAAANTVLGQKDFERIIFGPPGAHLDPSHGVRLLLGFGAVPWMLIASRTSLADSVLPIVPMIFLATHAREDPLRDLSTWPPSASLSFALLPYVRAIYNAYYEHFWGKKERRWLEEIKPRASSDAQGGVDVNIQDEDGEIVIDVGIEQDDDDNANGQAGRNNGDQALALDAPPQHVEADQPAEGEDRGRRRQQRREVISLSKVARSILGALIYPGISALMGDILRATLPTKFTATMMGRRPNRFLQTRWGRSIVGGCLFVVLKDAITLYVRWRMAQDHRKRKVVNYKGPRNIIPS